MNRTPEVVTLETVTTWLSGGTPNRTTPAYWGGDVPWISAASLKHTRIRDSDQRLTERGLRAGSQLAPEGSTLLLVRGMALHREARIGLAERPVSFNQDVKALVPRAGMLPEFLVYSLQARSQEILNLVSSAGSGTGVLDTGLLKRLLLWVPNVREQRAIVELISDADDLIAALELMIVKKHAIKQGLMQQLFRIVPGGASGVETTPKRLGTLLRLPATYGIVKAGEFQRTGVPMIRGGDIRDGRISSDLPRVTRRKSDEYARTVLQPGDVVVALVGYPGESAVVPSCLAGANISRAVGLLRPGNDLLPEFLVHYLNSPLGRRDFLKPSAGSAQIVVNLVDLNRMEVSIPTTDVQSAVAAILNDANAEIAKLRARLVKAIAVRTGMMQQLLTGRTRIPVNEDAA
jgi:type I restriction enzyme S subunit